MTRSTNDLPPGKRPRGRPKKETILPDPSELPPHRLANFESSMEVVADAVAEAALEMYSDAQALDFIRKFGLQIVKEAQDTKLHQKIMKGGSGDNEADKNKISLLKEGSYMVVSAVKQKTEIQERLSNSTIRVKYLKLKNELTQAQIDVLRPNPGDDNMFDGETTFEVVGPDHKVDELDTDSKSEE